MIIIIILIVLIYIEIINCIKIKYFSYDSYNLIYKTNIINKSQNNSFNFLIDTGSPYTWILGNKIKSSKFKKLPIENISIPFNNGDVDNFTMYDIKLYLNNISFDTKMGISYNDKINFVRLFDGMIGLGGFEANDENINHFKNRTIIYRMTNQKIIKNNIFSLYINKTNINKGDYNINGGDLIFGGIDNSKYEENIKWYDTKFFWSLNLSNITINKTLNINNIIKIDSGTEGFVFNKSVCDIIHEQIGGTYNENTGLYVFKDIDKVKNNISIYLNNDKFILTPNDYTYKFNNTFYSNFIVNNNNNIVLGLPFLRKYYSIYDFDNKKIGLAKSI